MVEAKQRMIHSNMDVNNMNSITYGGTRSRANFIELSALPLHGMDRSISCILTSEPTTKTKINTVTIVAESYTLDITKDSGLMQVLVYAEYVGIYCQLILDWIELTRAQIFSRQIQNGDTEPNSKYSLKKYFQIV